MNINTKRALYDLTMGGADVYLPGAPPSNEQPLGGDAIPNPDPKFLKAPWSDPEFQEAVAEKLYNDRCDIESLTKRTSEFERDMQGARAIFGRVLGK